MANEAAPETVAAPIRLARLVERQEQLAARVSEIDAEQRAANTAAVEASDALVALERAAALGTGVSENRRREHEDRLLQARSAV